MRKSEIDLYDDNEQKQPVIFEPLRVPSVVENFMAEYIPAMDERTATDIIPIGELRMRLACFVPYGSVKEDPLQEYLDILAERGYTLRSTVSGPALCLISRNSNQVVYDDSSYSLIDD